jgi:hypothetical protein
MNLKLSVSIIGILAVVCLISWLIYRQVEDYSSPQDLIETLRTNLKVVHPGIADIPIKKGEKSYTINKRKIYLCLEDENGDYYDENMLTYVLLHEFAHVLCDEQHHTDKFYRIFDDLLDRATHAGVYDPNKPIITDYCEY